MVPVLFRLGLHKGVINNRIRISASALGCCSGTQPRLETMRDKAFDCRLEITCVGFRVFRQPFVIMMASRFHV